MKKMIFTDLDGTFLNHDDYSFAASKSALKQVFAQKIPLIFTTSKTKTEVELLQKKVDIQEPFIVENGAALFIPKNYQGFDFSFLEVFEDYYIFQLGMSYAEITKFYRLFKASFGMLGFSDMTVEEIEKYTGLSTKDAVISKKRDFTEPFLLEDKSKLKSLEKLAILHGVRVTKGGRFYHLIGKNQDKGKAVAQCVKIFEDLYQLKIESIGLGDGQNDIPLLENVTIPIAIKNHKGAYVSLTNSQVQKSSYKGAKGWNEMILKNV